MKIKKLVLLHTRSITHGADEGDLPKHLYKMLVMQVVKVLK